MGEVDPGDESWIDERADRFERAWAAGGAPRLEDHIADVEEPRRSRLLEELVRVERQLRTASGEVPRAEEYRRRFPGHAGAIDAAFGVKEAPGADRPRAGGEVGRDLLFGILALQSDFIDRDALLSAFTAWVGDKSRPLGEVLLEAGALDAETHALLEGLVRKHLEMHGGDPERSLADLSSLVSARAALESVADTELQATLARIAAGRVGGAAEVMRAATGERFRILRFHARGGLGQVSVARDEELHRDVALKEIQGRYADDPASRSRFLVEAEITGRLEHPGVVPVYGLGTYADGRPFYAMRFIEGDDLRDAVGRFHAADGPGRAPGERALALRELLRRFLDVCNAIEYAHSRGVLHRDLKPHNILLGPYGETLVVDWGLAKVIGRPSGASHGEGATLRPESGSDGYATQSGSALGTPAYMSPEQAAGELDRLGPTSDVYSLGATLYCLLTGRAPFHGHDVDALLARVRRGEFPPPRAVARATDPALDAVCMKAMAMVPEGRYASPRALADDVEHWLAGEPVSCFRDPWPVRLKRWSRRHRWAVPTAAVVIALIPILAALAVVEGRRMAEFEANGQILKAEAMAQAARANEATQKRAFAEQIALYSKARQVRRDAEPGWTRVGLAALNGAASGPTGLLSPDDIRREAVAHLAEVDMGPGEPFVDSLDFNHSPTGGIAFNRDGSRVVASQGVPALGVDGGKSGFFGRVAVFDANSGKALYRLTWPSGRSVFSSLSDIVKGTSDRTERARCPAISPDGRWVAIATNLGGIHLWDLSSRNPQLGRAYWRAHDVYIRGLAFDGDSRSLVSSADDDTVVRWLLPGPSNDPPTPVARVKHVGRTGKLLAVDAVSGFVAGSGDRLFEFRGPGLTSKEFGGRLGEFWPDVFAVSPDGRSVAAVQNTGVRLLAREDDRQILTFRQEGSDWDVPGTSELQFHPDGSLLLETRSSPSLVDRGFKIWEVASGRRVAQVVMPGNFSVDASFTPDGGRVVATERRGDAWRLVSYRVVPSPVLSILGRPTQRVRAAALAPDGGTLACLSDEWVSSAATGANTHRIEASLWSVADGKPLGRQRIEGLYADANTVRHSIAFRPDGRQVAYAGSHMEFFIWGPGWEGGMGRISAGGSHPHAAFAEDGRLWGLVRDVGEEKTDRIVLINPGPPSVVESIWGDKNATTFWGTSALTGVAAGKGVVLAGTSWGTVQLVQGKLATRAWRVSYDDPVSCVALSPDESLSAIGMKSGEVQLQRVPGGEAVGVVKRAHEKSVASLAFARDGRSLASGSPDGTARLWRLVEGVPSEPLILPSPGGPVRSVAFSPDGGRLMMLVEGEYAVRMWDLVRLHEELEGIGLPW